MTQFNNRKTEFRTTGNHGPYEFTNGSPISKIACFQCQMFSLLCGRTQDGVKGFDVVIVSRHGKFRWFHVHPSMILEEFADACTTVDGDEIASLNDINTVVMS